MNIFSIFDFLLRKKNKFGFEIQDIKSRWPHYSNGLILDSKSLGEPVWIVGSLWFEKWFLGLEERLETVMGKRLIHASSEAMEFFLVSNIIKKPKNNNIDNWKTIKLDFFEKGLGDFSFFDEDSGDIKILIQNYTNLNIAIGYLSAIWEYMTNKRFKSSWVDSESHVLLTLTPILDTFPSPLYNGNFIEDFHKYSIVNNAEWWEILTISPAGNWSINNSNKIIVSNDIFERFIQLSIPYLNTVKFLRSNNYSWDIGDKNESLWWSAAADSAREQFYSDSFHIMIREPEDWKNIGARHLQRTGLGKIINAKYCDSENGILLSLDSVFHPSITCGILLGCWERAYGRNGKLILTRSIDNYFVKIISTHMEIDDNS